MNGILNVMPYHIAKLSKKKKTKPAHNNTTYWKFTCMEEYVNDVKSDLTDFNDPVCNDQSSKMMG